MPTLRQAVPNYKTNGIFKNMSDVSRLFTTMPGSPEMLDIMLIGKYGNREINTMMREFTNNQGVLTDVSGLSTFISQYYMEDWDRLVENWVEYYDALKPYNKTLESSETVNDEGTITETHTGTDTNEKEVGISGTVTNNGTETTDSTKTDTIAGTERDVFNIKNHQTTSAKSGTDTLSRTGYFTESTTTDSDRDVVTETNADAAGSLGVTHSIARAETTRMEGPKTSSSTTATIPIDASLGNTDVFTNQYDEGQIGSQTHAPTGSFETEAQQKQTSDFANGDSPWKATDKVVVADSDRVNVDISTLNGDVTLEKKKEVTSDNSDIQVDARTDNNLSDQQSYNSTVTETESYNDDLHKSIDHEYVNRTNTEDTDGTVTTANTETTSETQNVTQTNTLDLENNKTSNNERTDVIESVATGNVWIRSNTELMTQELELRKNHIWDHIIKDVARLLTISTYA